MDDNTYIKVGKDEFQQYPGSKHSSGHGHEMDYMVRMDQERPISQKDRELTDKLIEVLKETGLADQLAAGNLTAAQAILSLATAAVTATDECLPHYARGAVASLAREVMSQAAETAKWSVGAIATRRNGTVLQQRESELENGMKL